MSLLIAGTHKKVYAIISIEAYIKYLGQIIEISKKYHFALPFVYIYITINVVSVLLLRLITNCISPTINILTSFTIIPTFLTNKKLYICMYVWPSHIARVRINRVGSPILLEIR